MKRIRLPVALLLLWLLLFFSINWSRPPLQLSWLTRLAVAIGALVPLLLPRLARTHVWVLVGTANAVFLTLELVTAGLRGGEALPRIVTAVSLISITLLLARWVSLGVAEFEAVLANLAIGPLAERRARQGEIYREVQRARAHQRPLAILVLRHEGASEKLALERIVLETQQAMLKQYLMASISRTVCSVLDNYNVVAKRSDHFLVVLPEATPDTLPETSARLRRAILEQVGVEVRIGTALLPSDALTFEGLVEKALAGLEGEARAAVPPSAPSSTPSLETVLVPEASNGRLDRQ